MKKDRDIFELEAGERVAGTKLLLKVIKAIIIIREHERWIGYHGPTSSQRQSARAAVALYDEKTDNTRQLKEHIHNLNCPLIENKIRRAGKEIDKRLENHRPERELS